MNWVEVVLVAVCVVLVVLPRKWDPAIRLKEWTEEKRKHK